MSIKNPTPTPTTIPRRPDGSIDIDLWTARAHTFRSDAAVEIISWTWVRTVGIVQRLLGSADELIGHRIGTSRAD